MSQMSKDNFITAYISRVDEQGQLYQGYLSEVENSLKAEQKLLGGYIEVIRLTDEVCCIVNEEAKLLGLPANRLWKSDDEIYDFIAGNIECVRCNSEGEFTSILPEDIPMIESALVPIKNIVMVDGNAVFVTYPSDCLPKWEGGADGS